MAEEIGGESEIVFERVADAVFAVRTVEERDWPALDEFGSELKSHIEARAERDEQFMLRLAQRFEAVSNHMYELSQAGADPSGPEGRSAAQAMWAMIEDFTEGDMSLLPVSYTHLLLADVLEHQLKKPVFLFMVLFAELMTLPRDGHEEGS